MKILFTGLPYFGKRLVDELNGFDPENTYVFCDTYYSRKDRLKFLWHLLSAKKVVSFNGATSESGSLNWALKFKREIIMQWHGSDVLSARKNKEKGTFTTKYVNAARSYSDASWLIEELKELNVSATPAMFKHVAVSGLETPFAGPGVFAYIAAGQETFYGLPLLIQLVKAFPEIIFYVAGTNGEESEQLSNINYLGWISEEEFSSYLNQCPVFLRLPEHDGYSLSVLKALANGNYVIWTYPHEQAILATDRENLVHEFQKLNEHLKNCNFVRNKQAMVWAAENLNRKKVLKTYRDILLQDAK